MLSGVGVRQAVVASLRLLSPRDRRLLAVAVGIQVLTSALDLLGVLLLGVVAALAVAIASGQPAPGVVTAVADRVGVGGASEVALAVGLTVVAAMALMIKSVLSPLLIRRVLVFLANRQAVVSARLTRALLARPLLFVQQRTSQETAFALTLGARAATLGVLGNGAVIVAEVSLLVVLGGALLVVDPLITLEAVGFFCLVAGVLVWGMGRQAARLGATVVRTDVGALNAIQDALLAYREILVAHRRGMFADRVHARIWEGARARADSVFLQGFPKYIFEVALIVGTGALAGVLFATADPVRAFGTLALYLAGATRVMPAVLRLQGALLLARHEAAQAEPTFTLAAELGHPTTVATAAHDEALLRAALAGEHEGFTPSVSVRGVTVRHPGSSVPALDAVSVEVRPGQSVAFVGRTGAGKSTLADTVLGVVDPAVGSVTLSGCIPAEVYPRWPGAVAYVPQEVALLSGTVRENVALGLPAGIVDDDRVWEALERAHLDEYLRAQREGLDTQIGEGGLRLSGGQRQRLGIARALFTRPRLLVMDEATSALDAETEEAIGETIKAMGGEVTLLIIAHRLSTVRGVDLMVYLDNGRVVASGTFAEVRRRVPALDRQAGLMGL